MSLNIEAVKELVKNKFRDNKSWFAEVIGVDAGYFNQIINGKRSNNSFKVCNGVINYCKKNGLDYKEYINIE